MSCDGDVVGDVSGAHQGQHDGRTEELDTSHQWSSARARGGEGRQAGPLSDRLID